MKSVVCCSLSVHWAGRVLVDVPETLLLEDEGMCLLDT